MGVWGAGLYSGDFAMDLCTTIRALSRLPFDGDKILDILCSTEPTAARNPDDEDHTTFWLVVTDQFARRGIICEAARLKALNIIDTDADIAMLTRLGMKMSDLNKRRKVLAELRAQLQAPTEPVPPRKALQKPQPFLMDVGDVFTYPSSQGECINPYFPSKERMPGGWKPDGWNLAIIVDRGQAFDFLAWYRPLLAGAAGTTKPQIESLQSVATWILRRPGTCSAAHLKKMKMERIGVVSIDHSKLRQSFPSMPNGIYQAVNDISMANELGIPKRLITTPRPDPTLTSLAGILSASF
jgi:hypothetical protein